MASMEKEMVEKRAKVRKIIKGSLWFAIISSIASISHNASYEWCANHRSGADLVDDILHTWIEDEDGNIAIDRLINLILY